MNIRVGKYVLRSDQWCFWIDEEYTSKSGKVVAKRVTGYASSLENLFNDYEKRRVLLSDAESLDELLDVIEDAQDDIEVFIEKAVAQGYQKIEEKAKDIFVLGGNRR